MVKPTPLVVKVNTEELMKAMRGRHEMYAPRGMLFEETPFMYYYPNLEIGQTVKVVLGYNGTNRIPCAIIKKIGEDSYKLAWYFRSQND